MLFMVWSHVDSKDFSFYLGGKRVSLSQLLTIAYAEKGKLWKYLIKEGLVPESHLKKKKP